MNARPVRDFFLRKPKMELWMILFLFAGGLVLGAFLPEVGIALGGGIFIGTAALLFIEKRLADDKKKEDAKKEEMKA